MIRIAKLALAPTLLMLGSAASAATVVATRNFDSPDFTFAGVTASSTTGGGSTVGTQSILGFGANMFRNSTTGLWSITLSNLPAHTAVTIDLDLAFLDGWDSLDGTATPDLLTWSIDGTTISTLTANNASGSVNAFAGGTVQQGPANVWGIQWNDRIVDMAGSSLATFAHTNATLTFGLRAAAAGAQAEGERGVGVGKGGEGGGRHVDDPLIKAPTPDVCRALLDCATGKVIDIAAGVGGGEAVLVNPIDRPGKKIWSGGSVGAVPAVQECKIDSNGDRRVRRQVRQCHRPLAGGAVLEEAGTEIGDGLGANDTAAAGRSNRRHPGQREVRSIEVAGCNRD